MTRCRKCGTDRTTAIYTQRDELPIEVKDGVGSFVIKQKEKPAECDLRKKHSGQQTEAEKNRMINGGTPIGEFCVSTFKRKPSTGE
jgi:hypothetical protein